MRVAHRRGSRTGQILPGRCLLLALAVMTILLSIVVPAASGAGALPAGPTAYVTNAQLTSLSVYTGDQQVGSIANVGSGPAGVAIDSSGKTAYVADYGFLDNPSSTVTPVDLVRGKARKPFTVGSGPLAIALTPDDKFAVVTLQGTAADPGHQIQEINLSTRAVSAPVDVGTNPQSLAISPDGRTAYVAALSSAEVTPVDLTSWPPVALPAIVLPGTAPSGIAISPNGRNAYVLDAENATVIPISLPSDTVGPPLDLVCTKSGDPGCTPHDIVISHSGHKAYVAAAGSADVVVLKLPSLSVTGTLPVGAYPDALGLSRRWLYVGDAASNAMTIFTGSKHSQTVGGVTYPYGIAIAPAGPSADLAPVANPQPPPSQIAAQSPSEPYYGAP
jgi:DNA-binding beta-propeller fold protein YncE